MLVTKVLLRWYRSFNTIFHYSSDNGGSAKPWETVENAEKTSQHVFPFISIPLDTRITTIVGANESGKSHLLSALAKTFKGVGNERSPQEYAIQDICRYCAFEGFDARVWPTLGIELDFGPEEKAKYRAIADKALEASQRVTVIVNGGDASQFATVFDAKDARIKTHTKSEWLELVKTHLPAFKYIDAEVALSNEIHVSQLIDMYDDCQPGDAFDPIKLHALGRQVLDLTLPPAGTAVDADVLTSWNPAKQSLASAKLGAIKSARLEKLLFQDILKVDKPTLENIARLGTEHRGYVERTVADINHRILERLDIARFWQQDEDFKLEVDYKAGYFFFQIRDKTGHKYTFNERSSGLKYFLSYYIQAKAIRESNDKKGSFVVMDEPDGFLSALGQRNLLRVFETLAEPDPVNGACQLVYTTHSPFLINRNFPSRLRLVRKGDGSEGTHLVEASSTRRYEPVRSALGIECAENLFMGATNVIVEGVADQKLIVGAIQAFCKPDELDKWLDLNSVTFVSAGGAPSVPRLARNANSGDEKAPVFVVLLDADTEGEKAFAKLTGENILQKKFIRKLSDIPLPDGGDNAVVLEDLIPVEFLSDSVSAYLKYEWDIHATSEEIQEAINSSSGSSMSEKLVQVICDRGGEAAKGVTSVALRAGVVDRFVEVVLAADEPSRRAHRTVFRDRMATLCAEIRKVIEQAESAFRRNRLHRNVKMIVESFTKTHSDKATRAEVERCLVKLEDHCDGQLEDARLARENLSAMRARLDEEMTSASALVAIKVWLDRLNRFSKEPWTTKRDLWESR